MNRRNISKVIFAGIMLFFSACSSSLVPFTQQLREQYNLKQEDIKSIQFYTSRAFVLRRADRESSTGAQDGELTIRKNEKIEEIVIKAGTPCVVKEIVDGNRVIVSFEDGGNRYLVFGSINNRDGYYTLMALEWNKGIGKVNYGEKYYLTSRGSKDVFLTLKLKSLNQFKVEQKVVKGQKIR